MSQASELTNQVIDFIYRSGGYAWRASSTGIYDDKLQRFRLAPKKGVSDVLGCYRGRLLAIEVKIGKDRLSPEQQGFLKNVEHHGGSVFVARDFSSFQEWFNRVIHNLA